MSKFIFSVCNSQSLYFPYVTVRGYTIYEILFAVDDYADNNPLFFCNPIGALYWQSVKLHCKVKGWQHRIHYGIEIIYLVYEIATPL